MAKSAGPEAVLPMKPIASFHWASGGGHGVAHGSDPSSYTRSADAQNNLCAVLSTPENPKTFPLDQVFGTPKDTKRLLSDWTVFQCCSLSASASAASPLRASVDSKLGGGAWVLGATDLE